MAGVEVVGLITGIVSAFTGAYTAFTKWRKKRKDRKQESQNQALEVSLQSGASNIKSEYARYVALLGPRFKAGDEMAKAELYTYRDQSQKFLADINKLITLKVALLPNSPALIDVTDGTRIGTLYALGLQYQRMMQAAPLTSTGLNPRFKERQSRKIGFPARPEPLPNVQPRPRDVQDWGHGGLNHRFNERQPRPLELPARQDPLPSTQTYPLESVVPNKHSYPLESVKEFCAGALEFNGSDGKWQCSDCSFQASKHGFRNSFWPVPTGDAPLLHLHSWMFLISHLKSRSDHKGGGIPLFGCQVCPQAGHFTEPGLKQHLQQYTHHQLKETFGRSVQVCDCQAPHGRHQTFCAVERLLCDRECELERFSSGLPLHRWMSNVESHQPKRAYAHA